MKFWIALYCHSSSGHRKWCKVPTQF